MDELGVVGVRQLVDLVGGFFGQTNLCTGDRNTEGDRNDMPMTACYPSGKEISK